MKEKFAPVLENSVHGCPTVSWTAGDTHIMAGVYVR